MCACGQVCLGSVAAEGGLVTCSTHSLWGSLSRAVAGELVILSLQSLKISLLECFVSNQSPDDGHQSTLETPALSSYLPGQNEASPPGPGERDVAGVGTPSLCSAHSGLLANTHQIDTPKGVCFPYDIHHSWHVCLLWALTGFEMVKFQISF